MPSSPVRVKAVAVRSPRKSGISGNEGDSVRKVEAGNLTPKKPIRVAKDLAVTPPRALFSAKKSPMSSVSPFKKAAFGREIGSGIQMNARVRKAYRLVTKRNQLGGNGTTGAIYGELTMGSMQKVVNLMVDKCGMTHESRVIDVGAGLGKPNLHFAQDPGCRLSLGVELEDIRWRLSMFILDGILPEMNDGLPQQDGPEWTEEDEDDEVAPFMHMLCT